MLYEIGKPCDISAMLLRMNSASNRLSLVGTVVDEPKCFSKNKDLYILKVCINADRILDVYISESDIPHSKLVFIDGELWNSKKGYTAYRSTVDVYAQNVVELINVDDVPIEHHNSVYIDGTVCMHPVYYSAQERYEIVLLSRTSFGEVVRMLCSVPKDITVDMEQLEKGTRHCIKGEIMQKVHKKRCGKVYIEDGVFNYINS